MMRVVAAALLALLPLLAAQAQETPAPPPSPDAAPQPETPPPPAWLPRPAARLILLDKISAQPRAVTVKVGQSVGFGALTIAVRACQVRPPDVPQDATAFLDITDGHAGMPGFHGWMFADEPAANMLEHPVYDVRVAGCTG
ncbi:MAG TPA: DUF2155 domain-containing protein [Acetobacteraceae bacterium]|nr:DUF2155 domain-containing protein [Acetobacteraceae bacterium]